MTTIRELVQAYASAWVDSQLSGDPKYATEAEHTMQQIEGYYVPRPPGSVTVTHEEYDALVNICMTAQSVIALGVSDAALRTLAMQVDRYTEMLQGVE